MKNLTTRYSLTHFTHWAAYTGSMSFATSYLFIRGIPSEIVGTLLAIAVFCSCFTQPVFASIADRSKKFLLKKLLIGLYSVNCLCLLLQTISAIPTILAAILYVFGIWCGDLSSPLLNALSVACNASDYPINYGAARAVGAVASAVSSLVVGLILAKFGTMWMLIFLIAVRFFSILVLTGYPTLTKSLPTKMETAEESCGICTFFRRYPWFCVSIFGISFLGMYLAMTENYMIAILGALGGDSSHVGVALFISSVSGAPAIFFFQKIHAKLSDSRLLKIAAVTFLVRAVCFYFIRSIQLVYFIQILQATSYGFLAPTEVTFANAHVCKADMVKGQAFITAAYSLGCSAGNFIGGQLLPLGVQPMLAAGIAMALVGTVILLATSTKRDRFTETCRA